MSMTREQFFQVSFTSGEQRRTEYIRAWTAGAAKRAIADQLASEGIVVTGTIEAVPAAKRQPLESAAILTLAHAAHH